jgi:acetyl-CoA acetyltransferase
MSGLGGKVAIIGTGIIESGENFHQSLTDMIFETKLGRSLAVNTSGELGSCGHSIGSSGKRMIDNVHDQLLGRAGRMQVKCVDMGLAHNVGGPGAVSVMAILSQP